MSINHETQSPLYTNPVDTSEDHPHYDQDNHFQDAEESDQEEEEKLIPLSNVFLNDRPGPVVQESLDQSQTTQSAPVISSIKTDPITGVKYVDNYSGLYSKEEVLALHRLDYPVPSDFVWEEDITSRSGLLPVASFKYRRELDGSSNAPLHDSSNEQWEGNFFSRSVGRGKGRGRGRRDDQYGDEHLRGSRGGAPFDNTWRSTSEQPFPQDSYSAPLWQSNNPNVTSFQSSYRPTKRQLAASSIYPSHQSDLYQLQDDLSYANERWYYKDPKGHERGPFSSIQMDKWVKHDFFQIELFVRRENEAGFVLLGNLFIAEQRNPFTLVPLPQWLQGPSSGFKNRLLVLIHSYQVEKLQRDQAIREQSVGVVPGGESKGQGESLPSSITISVATLSVSSSDSSGHVGLAPPSAELEFPKLASQSNPLSESGSFSKGGHEQATAPWFPDTQDPINKSSLESASPVPIPTRNNWYDDITPPWGQNLEGYPWSSLPIGQSTAWNIPTDKSPNIILQEQTKVLTEIVEKMKDKPASKNNRKKKTKRAKAKEPKEDPQNQKKPSPTTSQKGNTTAPAPPANTAVTNTNAPKSNPKAPSTTQQQPQQHQKSPPQVKKTKPQYKLKQAPEPPEEQPKPPVEQPAIKKSIKYGKKPQVWKVVERKEEENVEITEGQDSSLENREEKI